jgi:cytoskeletal protein CcmA (bactofilin family)
MGPVNDAFASSTYIVMNGDCEIQANFEDTAQYTLAVSHAGNGSVISPGEGTFTYPANRVVTLQAQPDPNAGFGNWTGDVGTVEDPSDDFTTITMNGNYTIVANFLTYSLTTSHGTGGNVTRPGEGTFYYAPGDVVSLGANATSGHEFDNWTGDVTTVADVNAADTTVTMYGDYTVVANFAPETLCHDCWHYAVVALGGPESKFETTGDMAGDVFINSPDVLVKLKTAATLNGNLYWQGNIHMETGININGDASGQGSLSAATEARIYGNAYTTGNINLNDASIGQSAYSQGSISISKPTDIEGHAYAEGSITGADPARSHPWTEVTLPPFPTLTPPTASEIDTKALKYKTAAQTTGLPYKGSLTVSGTATLGGAGHYSYITGNLNISKAVVTLAGTVYVEGTITVGESQIVTTTSGPYAIVANNGASANNAVNLSSSVNATHVSPLPLIMAVHGGIAGGGAYEMGGVLYAPRGLVKLKTGFDVYGSAVGFSVVVQTGATVAHAPELDSRTDLPPCGCGS